mgnify:FL=1
MNNLIFLYLAFVKQNSPNWSLLRLIRQRKHPKKIATIFKVDAQPERFKIFLISKERNKESFSVFNSSDLLFIFMHFRRTITDFVKVWYGTYKNLRTMKFSKKPEDQDQISSVQDQMMVD